MEDDQIRELSRLQYEELKTDAFERLKYQVEYSHSILRGLTLVNGGAIVALFTLLGNLRPDAAITVDESMIWKAFVSFVCGLSLCLMAACCGFLSQHFYMSSSVSEAWTHRNRMVGLEEAHDHMDAYRIGSRIYVLALLLIIGSLISFIVGSSYALAGALAGH